MKVEKRKSILEDLTKYDYFAKEHDYIEITEWTNGEGFDISIYRNGEGTQNFKLTHNELSAIQYLTMALEYESKNIED